MQIYLVHSKIPEFTEEMAAVIPKHRKYVNELFELGVLHMYAVSEYRDNWWCAIKAESEEKVWNIINKMPIIDFLDPQVHPLMIYNGAEQLMPKISLN